MNEIGIGKGIIITGHAGVGKTTKLSEILKKIVENNDFKSHKILPVISAKHGARKRLKERLRELQKNLKNKQVCFSVNTIDSFALSIANYGREFIGISKPLIPFHTKFVKEPSYGTIPVNNICEKAIEVLNLDMIKQAVKNSYPVVIIDEFQDCKNDKLEFIKKINECVPIIVAADAFQDIDIDDYSAPAVKWGLENLKHIDLGKNSKRSFNSRINNSAAALRKISGTTGPYVHVYTYKGHGQAAKTIMTYVRKYHWNKNVALLTYKVRDLFVKGILDSLHKERNIDDEMQPLPFTIINNEEVESELIIEEVEKVLSDSVSVFSSPPSDINNIIWKAWQKCQIRNRRLGKKEITSKNLIEFVLQELHYKRSYGFAYPQRSVLSIHSAKNQEWENVFIAWNNRQFPEKADEEYRRRILYNAITRAKRNCLVLVYDPKGEAFKQDNFLEVLHKGIKIN
ncbi:MAG: ATP-binding domain-containing protein [Candidatus Helarchaeota archaeon]